MLNINTEFNSGIYFVRLEGSFNKLNYNIYMDTINFNIKKFGIKNLVINFNKLKNIDDKGIETLFKSYDEILNNHGNLLVIDNKFNIKYFKEVNNELSALKILKI